ncbi:uncharacterized protein LOC131690682 [Topomyia yanbarensis]|uniref:uncharacterized protein LOC131690682 n=1 Tax=Topomyia yanbarensis TaxID=2498891 RepID=UPI00273AFA56|nr:uncharacterized protein LOC131690682 [Topomyia yanbarensis]
MKLLLVTLLIITWVFTCCKAYVRYSPNATHPDYPNQCFDAIGQIHVDVGTTVHNKHCERVTCYEDYSMSITGCGVIAASSQCQLTPTDYEKPYPDCCPRMDCSTSKTDV